MEKTNEILTIAGERVEVRYESDFYEACDKCCFHNIFVRCNVRTLCHGCPCEKYRDDKNRRFAYFVRTEEDENKPQKALPEVIYCGRNCYGNLSYSNTKVLPNMRPYVPAEEIEGTPKEVTLIPSNEDEDEAAEMAARRAYPYEGGTKGDICEASIPIFCKGFKAGIAYERERLSSCPTIKGWVAREPYGEIVVFSDKPTHDDEGWIGPVLAYRGEDEFPDLRWGDEPREVELPIIIKKEK